MIFLMPFIIPFNLLNIDNLKPDIIHVRTGFKRRDISFNNCKFYSAFTGTYCQSPSTALNRSLGRRLFNRIHTMLPQGLPKEGRYYSLNYLVDGE